MLRTAKGTSSKVCFALFFLFSHDRPSRVLCVSSEQTSSFKRGGGRVRLEGLSKPVMCTVQQCVVVPLFCLLWLPICRRVVCGVLRFGRVPH